MFQGWDDGLSLQTAFEAFVEFATRADVHNKNSVMASVGLVHNAVTRALVSDDVLA